MKKLFFIFIFLTVHQAQAQLQLDQIFVPSVYQNGTVDEQALFATNDRLTLFNQSDYNHTISIMVYRLINSQIVSEANLFYLLPTSDCSLPNFTIAEDQAVLSCQTEDNLERLYLFEFQTGSWVLSTSIDLARSQSVSSIKGQKNQFILRTSSGFMLLEKKQGVWQTLPLYQSKNSTQSVKDLILINDSTALGIFSNGTQENIFYLKRDKLNNWNLSQALAPHSIQFGDYIRNLQISGDRLLIENGDGKKLRIEIFKIENTGLFRYEQTVLVEDRITYYNSPTVIMSGTNLIIARPYDDIAGAPQWSGRIDVYKPLATGQYRFAHSTGAGAYSEARLNLGSSLAANDNFIFALTDSLPSTAHQGDSKKQIFIYRLQQ